MEKRNRYTILGLTDGLFLGIGIALGISFFNDYSFTFISILLVGVTGALSNLFATYNAEEYVTGEQIKEYKRILFARDYNPRKIRHARHASSVKAALSSFGATLVGSFVVLAPYIISSAVSYGGIKETSVVSLLISLAILGYVGSRNKEKKDRAKGGLKMVGLGLLIAMASSGVGLAVSSLL